MRNLPKNLTLFPASLVLLLFLPACLIGSKSSTDSTGVHIAESTFSQMQAGQSARFVQDLLGEPTQIIETDNEGGEIWKWAFSETSVNKVSIFLVLGTETSDNSEGAVFVEFQDGKVVNTWRE
jgi:hypothetical protein